MKNYLYTGFAISFLAITGSAYAASTDTSNVNIPQIVNVQPGTHNYDANNNSVTTAIYGYSPNNAKGAALLPNAMAVNDGYTVSISGRVDSAPRTNVPGANNSVSVAMHADHSTGSLTIKGQGNILDGKTIIQDTLNNQTGTAGINVNGTYDFNTVTIEGDGNTVGVNQQGGNAMVQGADFGYVSIYGQDNTALINQKGNVLRAAISQGYIFPGMTSPNDWLSTNILDINTFIPTAGYMMVSPVMNDRAFITQNAGSMGNDYAAITQGGSNENASILQNGDDNRALIIQAKNSNTDTISQTGSGFRAVIVDYLANDNVTINQNPANIANPGSTNTSATNAHIITNARFVQVLRTK